MMHREPEQRVDGMMPKPRARRMPSPFAVSTLRDTLTLRRALSPAAVRIMQCSAAGAAFDERSGGYGLCFGWVEGVPTIVGPPFEE